MGLSLPTPLSYFILGNYPKETRTHVYKEAQNGIFTADALFASEKKNRSNLNFQQENG